MREQQVIKDDINKKLIEFNYLKSIQNSTIKFDISRKLMNLIENGEVTEYYLPVCGSSTRKITTNPKKLYIIGIGWTNYTIHKDADDFRKFSDSGTNEEVHYMKRKLDNIREDAKLRPFGTLTFRSINKTETRIVNTTFRTMVIKPSATQYDVCKHKGYVISLEFHPPKKHKHAKH